MKTLKYLIAVFATVLLVQVSHAQKQETDSTFVLSGKICDPTTKKGIAFAHIVVDETRRGAICDSLGFFHLRVSPNQHLHITALSFREHLYPITIKPQEGEAFVEIPMERQSYLLEEISVYNLGTYAQFKHNFIHSKLPEEPENMASNWKMPNFKIDYQIAESMRRQGFGLSMGGGSSKSKSAIKVENLKANEYKQDILAKKYNRTIVRNLTHETGKRLDALMVYINDRQMFTFQTSEYHIGLKVKQYHKDFLQKFPPVIDNYALTDSLNLDSVKDTLYAK